jgi:hypothetical protein
MRDAARITIRMERTDVEGLEGFAYSAGVGVAEYVRNALARHVQAKRRRR